MEMTDNWYCYYAAFKAGERPQLLLSLQSHCRCICGIVKGILLRTGPNVLMVSCDEMRDHLFQLLAPKYFKKWKQRHQVYYRQALALSKLCYCETQGCRCAPPQHVNIFVQSGRGACKPANPNGLL